MDVDRIQLVTSQIQARCGHGRGPHIGTSGDLFGSAGQAAREKQPLRHGRYRHGGVFGVFHAEPVVPGSSAAFGGRVRAWPLELRDAVWDGADSERQPCSGYVGPGGAGMLPRAVSPSGRSVASRWRAHGLPSAGDHVLIALDGTEYHRSTKLHCACCSTRERSGGTTEYFHTLVAATLVAPGHSRVVPLEPEFVVPQDGHDKQDCESMAARRWLAAHGPSYARLDPVYLGDDLYSRQPICQAVRAAGGHFLFVCKPSSHPTIEEYLSGVELAQLTKRVKHGRQRFTHTYRWLCEVPLRDGADAMTVNWLMIEIRNAAGEVTYHNSFITDLPTDRDTVVALAACGRARWKIENESFNTLKNKGYNLEHNFGHGKKHLSAVLATLNLLAFTFHTVAELTYDLWLQAINKTGARSRFFERLRSITVFLLFPDWQNLMTTLAFAHPPSQPP